MIVGGRLADVIGGKWVYGCGLFLSSILSIFTPLLLTRRPDAWAAFGLRIAQGCLHGVTFPALHAMTVRWTTEGGRGLFVAKVTGRAVFTWCAVDLFCGGVASLDCDGCSNCELCGRLSCRGAYLSRDWRLAD